MTWTAERIKAEWLADEMGIIGVAADDAVAAFTAIERNLGPAWLEAQHRAPNGFTRWGPAVVLSMVELGRCLESVENLPGHELLVEKVRRGDPSVISEMESVRMMRLIDHVDIELAPELRVGTSLKKPDFRVRRASEQWIYVEVTRPGSSEAFVAAQKVLERLQNVIEIPRSFSMEIFLRREPTNFEEDDLRALALRLADSERIETVDIPGLALVIKEPYGGPVVVPRNHPGEATVPVRLGTAKMAISNDPKVPHRMIAVRMPLSDERADDFLKKEAKQLSRNEPGLIMIDMTLLRGDMNGWATLLRRRLQANLHTRVGGICLFAGGQENSKTGEAILFDYRLLENQYAAHTLPGWVLAGLRRLADADQARRRITDASSPDRAFGTFVSRVSVENASGPIAIDRFSVDKAK